MYFCRKIVALTLESCDVRTAADTDDVSICWQSTLQNSWKKHWIRDDSAWHRLNQKKSSNSFNQAWSGNRPRSMWKSKITLEDCATTPVCWIKIIKLGIQQVQQSHPLRRINLGQPNRVLVNFSSALAYLTAFTFYYFFELFSLAKKPILDCWPFGECLSGAVKLGIPIKATDSCH